MKKILPLALILLATVISTSILQASPMNEEMKGSTKGSLTGSTMESLNKNKTKAKAIIRGTTDNSNIEGEIILLETPAGLNITANLSHVPDPGKHGIHIHQNGSCMDNGKAAGGHYNPLRKKHGLYKADGPDASHPGDMGNIIVDENGSAMLKTFLPGVFLSDGPLTVGGRAIILHAKEDDFGQPTGNAGARIGCGTIVLIGE